MGCTFKNVALTISKFWFYSTIILKILFHRLLYNLLEKRIKNGGHLSNFGLEEQNLSLPPHILR